ncbi:MAG: hypothetical protein DHS20C14_02810 [Phycisphaeraceae bacterium]|nr:MAG: hypothetical protein DHS20C14_02810 [Phycisphaeraceae bacterium]
MIKRLLRSRGAAKFRRNKLAMFSLAIIVAYVLLSVYIVATNVVNDHVAKDKLEGRPLLGLLLTSQTREIFGPREMPGFGLEGSASQRYEASLFYLEIASNAFRDIDRIGESGRDPNDVLRDYEVTGRPFADLPIEDLRAIRERARAQADRVLEVRRQAGSIELLPVLIGKLSANRDALEQLIASGQTDTDEAFNRQEDVSFGLEEIAEQIETFQANTGADNPMSAIDAQELLDVATDIFDAEDIASSPLYDKALIDRVTAAAAESRETLDARLGAEVDTLRPIINELFPEPEGLASAMNSFRLSLGTDRQGRSILIRALYSAKIAIQVGVVTALIAVGFGSVLGAAGAFFGGWVDHLVNWLYSMFTSIPYLVLLAVLAMLFLGSKFEGTLIPLYVAFALTYWIGPCRVTRGEAMKIKELEYVQAATAIGFGRFYILIRHILPNTAHLMFINFSLLLIAAIKGEVILTFLGLGLKQGASWGIMIRDSAQQVVNDNFWQIGAATFFMFLLVLAFNIFTDALQDAFDPKHVA